MRFWTFLCLSCVFSVVALGCAATGPRMYVAPAGGEPTIRAVHRALDAMQYATSDGSFDPANRYVVTAFDRDGNRVRVTVFPEAGQSTHVEVSVTPGENDAIKQQIIRVIDREVRR